MIPNSVIVLRALLMGLPCCLGAYTYFLDNDNLLYIQGYAKNGSKSDRLIVRYDLTEFIEICDNADVTDIHAIAINISMNTKRGVNE